MQTRMNRTPYRCALVVSVATTLILVWLSSGVGIIGRDGDPANLMYFGVLAVGIIGAAVARLEAAGMALAQTCVTAIALLAGLGLPWSGPLEILLLNGFFAALFAGSALLFRRSVPTDPDTVPR